MPLQNVADLLADMWVEWKEDFGRMLIRLFGWLAGILNGLLGSMHNEFNA